MCTEEYIKRAVEMLDAELFEGDLDLLNHQFQVSWGRTPGKKMSESIFPFDGEDVKLEDFFPVTICINYTIKDPIEFLGNLALECIHAFFDEKKVNKRFKSLAHKYYFDTPYTSYHPTPYLRDILEAIYVKLTKECGSFPIKPVVFYPKEKKEGKKNTLVMFCPNCNFEVKVSRKTFEKNGQKCCVCPCGTHMGIDYGEEVNEQSTDEA